MIGRILLTVLSLMVAGFVLLVLIGLWDRYEQEAVALGFNGPVERYAANQAGFPNDPEGYRAELLRMSQGYVAGDAEFSLHAAIVRDVAMEE
jgi:hypothetical protein